MFAQTPLWERDARKRRRTTSDGPRRNDPSIDAGEAGAGAGVIGATTAAEPLDAAYETQPAPHSLRSARRGVSAGALGAGVAVAAALSALGWYASQRHENGVAELTPGQLATSELALGPASPQPAAGPGARPPTQQALEQQSLPPAKRSAPAAEPRRSADAKPARVRPAPVPDSSALSSGVDASATAPTIQSPSPPRRSLQPTPENPVVNPVNPVAPPSATTPPPGSIDDSAAPTASRAPDPSATP